ncbi:LysR family transcriptional regulator [Kribbella sp. NPDC005582]|uniref:LysR family transcriptional regulator n=1 Tax=Kribbella sp. NPDC005582 TaxID=3156893 RepID=UPI00339E8255
MSELEPDSRSLLVFHVVVEEGSMSAAARRLGWTHPAISQHIQRLERAAGTALLIRYGRGVRPTAAGAELAAATAMLASAQSVAAATLRRLGAAGSAVVRVAAFPTACATFLVDAVSAVAPVRVQLTQAEPEAALAMLAERKADLAVVFDDEPALVPVDRVQLLDDALVLVVPEGHELASMPSVAVARLGEYTVVAGCNRCRRRLWQHGLRAGVRLELHHQDTDDYVVMQAMVAAGQGPAVLPALALRAHHRAGLVAVPLEPPLTRRISVCRPAGRAAPDEVSRVLEEIVAQVT